MKRIRVLIIAGEMNIGGQENQLMNIIRYADKRKFQIDFTSTAHNPHYKKEMIALGGQCLFIRDTEGRHFLRYCLDLYKILKKGKYDIVHANELFHSGMVLAVAKYAGVKGRIAHSHSSNQDYKGDYLRQAYSAVMRKMILRYGNCFLACSSVAAEFLYGHSILQNPRYHLIKNSVDTERFLTASFSETDETPSQGDWKNVLQVGRFCDVKNFLFTCDLAKWCRDNGKKIRFLCVGNSGIGSEYEYEKEVRQKIEAFGIEGYMHILGLRSDVEMLMKKADALLLPSKFEGMPLTIIEAQASGLPCVVADTFSHEVDFGIDLITWLKLNDGVERWVEELIKAVGKERPRREIIQAAIDKGGFDSSAYAAKICSLYEQLYKEKAYKL